MEQEVESLKQLVMQLCDRVSSLESENEQLRNILETQHIQHMNMINMVMNDQKVLSNFIVAKSSLASPPQQATTPNTSNNDEQKLSPLFNRRSHLSLPILQSPLTSLTRGDRNSLSFNSVVQPLTVAFLPVQSNIFTRACIQFLQEKFRAPDLSRIIEIDDTFVAAKKYDLLLVICSRTSTLLEPILLQASNHAIPTNHPNCWFVCGYSNIWDDKCDYKELLETFPCKGVLQLNVWAEEVQVKNSQKTTQSIQLIDNMIDAQGLSIPGTAPTTSTGSRKIPLFGSLGAKLWK